MTRTVAVTGYGIVSALGRDTSVVSRKLAEMQSGIVPVPEHAEMGFFSHVAGVPELGVLPEALGRRATKNMGPGALYGVVSQFDAIEMAGLPPDLVSNPRTGMISATGSGSTEDMYAFPGEVEKRGKTKVPGVTNAVAKTMASTNSANAAVFFSMKGSGFTVSSACASSAIAVGRAARDIVHGYYDVMLVNAGDGLHWTQSSMFDGMGVLSTWDGEPSASSRPLSVDRKGFVIAGGGGALILEELEHAKRRGAKILGILAGYGESTCGSDSMTDPTVEGPVRAMLDALDGFDGQGVGRIDYVNGHLTATDVGDVNEMKAIQLVFGEVGIPGISGTKALTGHTLGSAGIQEAIYCLLAIRDGFMPGSAHIAELDPRIAEIPASSGVLRGTAHQQPKTALSNSFGFGGTNATLVLCQY